jgi:hypothetical protein
MQRLEFPGYADLLKRTDAPRGSSWGLFGADDEVGTLNFLTPDTILAARSCVRRGAFFNLDCSLDAFHPPILAHRKTLQHSIFGSSPHHRDDCIDSFYLQSGTQVDGLRHFRHPVHGFYNARQDSEVAVGSPTLGVNRMADHGIVARGVLVDMERYFSARGKKLSYFEGEPIDVDLVDEAADEQGVEFRSGDILMLRTGWLKHYFGLPETARAQLPAHMSCPGLEQSHKSLGWMWDHQFSVCASDNFALECFPPVETSPFADEVRDVADVHPRHAGMMHASMIALLGLTIGEQWDLEKLTADCASDGVWDCFVSVKPLNLLGGVGSPANAFALK